VTADVDDACGRCSTVAWLYDPAFGKLSAENPGISGCLGTVFFLEEGMITDRDILILVALVRYYVLNRQQIQRLVFPSDQNGRITRRRLQLLVSEHLISRQNLLFAHPSMPPAPVYYPAPKGCELLAEHFEDPRYLVTPTAAPIPHHTFHWLAVSDTHIAFDEAVKLQEEAKILGWLNEWDVVNKSESRPEKRFQLYTLLREHPRLVCVPDSAFLVCFRGQSKVFYLEQDRATSGVNQIANSKTAGYAELSERKLHRRHFPQATLDSFSVLMVAPTAKRRDALRRAIKEKPGANLWRFAAAEDLVPEKVLFEPIYFTCDGDEPNPLLRRP
jgi:hypothetical protein